MSDPLLQNTVHDAQGNPVGPGAMVAVQLVGGPGFRTDNPGVEIITAAFTQTDAAGAYSIPLAPNSLINPAGTYYLVSEPNGTSWHVSIPAGAGPFQLQSVLVAQPSPPSGQVVVLAAESVTQAANSATAAANSASAAGSSQTAAAGSASAASTSAGNAKTSETNAATSASAAQAAAASVPITPGKNLFDSSAASQGYYWAGATAPSAVAGWMASVLIPVTVGQTYTMSNGQDLQAFDTSKNMTTAIPYHHDVTFGTFTVTIPVGVAYVGVDNTIAREASPGTRCQLEVGAAATTYEPFGGRMPRLLTNGDYLDNQIAVALTPSTRYADSSIRVQRSGGDLSIRHPFDATTDLVQPLSLARVGVAGAPMVMLVTDQIQYVYRVPATATDAQVFPAIAAGILPSSTAMQSTGDDNTPVMAGASYVGANHGWNAVAQVIMTGHGKTAADLGSQWSDGTRTYTLLKIVDVNTLWMGCPYTISTGTTPGEVTPGTTLPAAALTHVSGATHTTTVTITGGVTLVQCTPSTWGQTSMATLDGHLIGDGVYGGQVLTVVETYQIVSYKGLIDWAQAHIGVDPFANLPAMTQLGRVSNTYRWTAAGCVIAQTVTWTEACRASVGITQQYGLQTPAGGSIKQYMPGVGVASDGTNNYDLRTEAPLAATSGSVSIGSAQQLDVAVPANRSYQWAYTSGGTKAYGVMVAILPVMGGKDATRRSNGTDAQSWLVSLSSKKNYPQVAYGVHFAAGATISGMAVRRYLAPSTYTPEQTVTDGSRWWLYIDRTDAVAAATVARTPDILGRALTTIGSATLTTAATYVTGEGVTYTCTAPGYLRAEAVVDTTV